MDLTAFARILSDLIARIPGAFACALVDLGGETVDYAGLCEPFDIKIAAAHMRIVMNDLEEYALLGEPRWVVLRGAKRSLVARRLFEGYALVLILRRRAGFSASRAFAVCERELAVEADWRTATASSWFAVDVAADHRGRPTLLGSPAVAVHVLGSVMGLRPSESGFRVRTATGSELTLVREPGNRWYADEDPAGFRPR